MKRLILFSAIIFGSLSCGTSQTEQSTEAAVSSNEIQVVSAEKFNKLLEDESVLLLDVRTAEEVAQGQIKGAINLDFYSADFSQKLAALDPSKPVLVYCSAGKRSMQAAEMMQKLGFKTVTNLEGGLSPWTQAGFPLVK